MPIFSKKVNSLMVDLEKSGGQYWNVPREVGQILYFLIRSLKPKRVLEVGTSSGYSGIWMAQALQDNWKDFGVKGELITIESHKERFLLAKGNFEKAGLTDFVKQVQGHAPEVFSTDTNIMEGGFGMLFLDATKKQYEEFLKQGVTFLLNGGVLVADNILSHSLETLPFVELAESLPFLKGEVVSIGSGLYVASKLGS